MIDYTYKDLYYQDSVDKQLKIEVEDGTVITNEDIFSESMTLTESLCSDTNLSFGSCEASKFEIKIANQFYSMKGMWLSVSEVLNGHENEPFVFGKYKVESDRPTADRSFREIVAYDALYDIINADVTDVAEWYETLLPELDSTVTLKEFRDSFFAHFNIEQEEVELPNDDMIVEKTITAASLSGKEVVTAICEINGCFGHIGRDNKFHYIFLPEISDGNAYALAVDDDTFLVTPSRNASTSAILGHAVLGDAVLGDDSIPSKTAVLGYATLGRAVLANEDEPPEVHEFGIGISHTDGAKQATVIEKENWQAIDYEDYVTETISSLQLRYNTSEAGYTYDFGVGGNNYIIDGNFLIYGKDNEETHEIAKNIYDKISCVSYRPTDATLRGNPCFEVGDPIQLNSKYQVINTYIIKRTLSGIQALKDNYESTGDETYDNAYNSISYEVEQLRGISNTFERTVEQNTLEIKNLEGQVSTIDQTINSISLEVTGSLGETASIIMKVGDEALSGDIDLSGVREAFAEEYSSIEISAGIIAFVSNTLVVESSNFTLDGAGNATFSGTISSPKGNIGGFTIGTSFLFNGTYSLEDDYPGVYLGTNGIRICGDSNHNLTINSLGSLFAVGGSTYNNGETYYPEIDMLGGSLSLFAYDYSIATSPIGGLHIDPDGIYGYYLDESAWLNIDNISKSISVNGSIISDSDESLKKDIEPLMAQKENYEKIIESLEPVTFEYKSGGKYHIGFTYQNAVKALEAGGVDPDNCAMVDLIKDRNTGKEYGGIEYNDIVALLVYEVQKLKKQVDSL